MDRLKPHIKIYIFSIVLVFITSCENISLSVDCAECYQEEPEWGDLKVRVTINDDNNYVPLVVYKGDFENNDIDWIDTAYEEDYYLEVQLNQYYSVVAEYLSGIDTICAVDGDKIKTKVNYDDCDEECYVIKGGNIDIRLKKEYQ